MRLSFLSSTLVLGLGIASNLVHAEESGKTDGAASGQELLDSAKPNAASTTEAAQPAIAPPSNESSNKVSEQNTEENKSALATHSTRDLELVPRHELEKALLRITALEEKISLISETTLDTSYYVRKGKKFEALIGPSVRMAMGYSSFNGTATNNLLNVSYFVNSDLKVGFLYGTSDQSFTTTDTGKFSSSVSGPSSSPYMPTATASEIKTSFKGAGKVTGLNMRYFLGNSFHLDLGYVMNAASVACSSIKYNNNLPDGKCWSESAPYKTTNLDLSLGNQWSWRYFTLNWDWLSLSRGQQVSLAGRDIRSVYQGSDKSFGLLFSGLSMGAAF